MCSNPLGRIIYVTLGGSSRNAIEVASQTFHSTGDIDHRRIREGGVLCLIAKVIDQAHVRNKSHFSGESSAREFLGDKG